MRAAFDRLPTATKLLLLMSFALLPLGLAMIWAARSDIDRANAALDLRAAEQDHAVSRAIEGLVARNALALRIAANAALATPDANDCEEARRSLAIAPAVSRNFSIEGSDGSEHCVTPSFAPSTGARFAPPGGIALWLDPAGRALFVRVGVVGGMATDRIAFEELSSAARDVANDIVSLNLDDGINSAAVIGRNDRSNHHAFAARHEVADGQLSVRASVPVTGLSTGDWLLFLLPLIMWVVAALISWWLVSWLLLRPLRRLERAVVTHDPGAGAGNFALPRGIGPAIEIHRLGEAFARSVERSETSERDMGAALEGQRRLVREVHHRVKNNLQVVASLLSIHGRNVTAPEGRAAYSAIARRVDALAVVHRNHFAEGEDNRGIALRPLLTELAAGLRGSAPDEARRMSIALDVDVAATTQDVAVAAAFLVTEVVEFAMLRLPEAPLEIELRRTSELTSRLTIESAVLTEADPSDKDKVQFERVITGLARQLRSSLEYRLGRMSVELPVFPA
ncbi:MAG: histidine kinase dimerization/phosphoacceptor domain -containing protein [Sphingomicrobium sp.]